MIILIIINVKHGERDGKKDSIRISIQLDGNI